MTMTVSVSDFPSLFYVMSYPHINTMNNEP